MIIDINSDSIPDFILKHARKKVSFFCSREFTITDHYITFEPLNGTQFTKHPLEFGASINEQTCWSSVASDLAWTQHNILKSCSVKKRMYGEWFRVPDQYIGLKVNVEGNIFYGWMRIEVAKDASNIKVYDFACSVKPNQKIFCSNNFSAALLLPMLQIPETENDVTMKSIIRTRN